MPTFCARRGALCGAASQPARPTRPPASSTLHHPARPLLPCHPYTPTPPTPQPPALALCRLSEHVLGFGLDLRAAMAGPTDLVGEKRTTANHRVRRKTEKRRRASGEHDPKLWKRRVGRACARWNNGAACAGGRHWWWLTKERGGRGRVLSIGLGGECIEATAKWRGVTIGVIAGWFGNATRGRVRWMVVGKWCLTVVTALGG